MKTLIQTILVVITGFLGFHTTLAQDPSAHSSNDSSENKLTYIKVNLAQVFFGGVLFQNSSVDKTIYVPGVFELVQFNTVEGAVFNPKISITKQLREGKFYAIKPNLRYGFGSKRIYGKLATSYYYNPSRFGSLVLNGGKFVKQFDQRSTLTPFANSSSTLFFQDNFLKIYESYFIEMSHSFSPLKNVQLTNRIFWSSRAVLDNLEEFNDVNKEYTSNDPVNKEVGLTAFESHQVFYQQTEIRWQPNLNYEYRRGKWVPMSNSPAIILKYKSAYSEVLGSDLAYQNIALGLEGTIQMGVLGEGVFSLEGGDFISRDSLSFVDFNHFQGNRTTYTTYEPGTFQLLDFYLHSTTGSYFRSHYTHTFKSIKNRFIPIMEGSYLHSLTSNYVELGVGIQRASKPVRVSFYNSWIDGRHDRAEIRFGLVLSKL